MYCWRGYGERGTFGSYVYWWENEIVQFRSQFFVVFIFIIKCFFNKLAISFSGVYFVDIFVYVRKDVLVEGWKFFKFSSRKLGQSSQVRFSGYVEQCVANGDDFQGSIGRGFFVLGIFCKVMYGVYSILFFVILRCGIQKNVFRFVCSFLKKQRKANLIKMVVYRDKEKFSRQGGEGGRWFGVVFLCFFGY